MQLPAWLRRRLFDNAPEDLVIQKTVQVNGLQIAYQEEPDPSREKPLILIAGLGLSSDSFRRLLPLLVPDFYVIAPDLPGAGASAQPKKAPGVDALVDVLVAWLDELGLDRVDFLGHSLGAQVVGRLAARYPERVNRLVLVSCTPDPSAPHAWQNAVRLAKDGLIEPFEVIIQAVGDYLRATLWTEWHTLKKALRSDAEDVARQIPVPTLVVRGERDPVITQAWAERLTELIPDAQLRIVEGGTHGVPGQSPDRLGEVIREFLL